MIPYTNAFMYSFFYLYLLPLVLYYDYTGFQLCIVVYISVHKYCFREAVFCCRLDYYYN